MPRSKERRKEYDNIPENRERKRAAQRKWRDTNKERLNANLRIWHKKNKERLSILRKYEIWSRGAKYKEMCVEKYSNGSMKCVECDVTDIDMLTMDHINSGGGKHRRSLHNNTYSWLVRQKFLPGYQVLCANHNQKKELLLRREIAKNKLEEDMKRTGITPRPAPDKYALGQYKRKK